METVEMVLPVSTIACCMHFDSIMKFFAIVTPAATTSSEVREVSYNMERGFCT